MLEAKSYYINLDSSKDRRKTMEESFVEDLIRISGIDGMKWSDMTCDRYNRWNWRPEILKTLKEQNIVASVNKHFHSLFPHEVACNLSHASALVKFLESDYDWGIIMEDDVEPTERSKGKVLAKLLDPPSDASMIYLCGPDHPGRRIELYPDGQVKWARTLMAYAVTREMAGLMIQAIFPMCYLSDCQVPVRLFESLEPFKHNWVHESLVELPRVKAYGLFEPLVQHSNHAKITTFTKDGTKKYIPKEGRIE